jgi:hypothetical protein
MAETFTDHDLRDQVTASLTSDAEDFDVQGIVDEIQAAYGTVPISQVPHAVYWGIVERHDNTRLQDEDINERYEENLKRWNANNA